MRRFTSWHICLLFFFMCILAYVFIPHKIIIKNLDCQSQNGACTPRILSTLASFKGRSLASVKAEVRSYLTNEVLARDIVIGYKYPSTVKIRIIEPDALYALTDPEGTTYKLVDQSGYVVATQESTDLPIAIVEGSLPDIGDRLVDTDLFSLQILSILSSNYQLSKGRITSDGLLIEIPTKGQVLFPTEGDKDLVLGKFVLVMNQLNRNQTGSTMEDISLQGKIVDLRFENPVIR